MPEEWKNKVARKEIMDVIRIKEKKLHHKSVVEFCQYVIGHNAADHKAQTKWV